MTDDCPDESGDDGQVNVLCVECGQRYVSSLGSFNQQANECPRRDCKSSKAQLLEDPETKKESK